MEQTMSQGAITEVPAGPQKKNKGLIWGIITCAVLVCAGVAFGVYGIIEINNKESEISDLKAQIEGENDAATVKTKSDSNSTAQRKNPIISADPSRVYNLGAKSAIVQVDGKNYYVVLNIKNGTIDGCEIFSQSVKWVDYDDIRTNKYDRDCNGLNGVSGKIYKAVDSVGEGQDGTLSSVAFIMEDGTVEYIPSIDLVTDMVTNGVSNIKGTLSIDGFVIDAFQVGVGNKDGSAGGYATTIFVLSDGSYVKFDESMLE